MDKSTVFFVLLSMIVASVYGQCSCQTKPPTNVIYEKGEGCECGRKYPAHVEVPKITEHRDAHYDYGFTIENPQQPSKPAEVRYSFDFHLEKPQPPPSSASLATYGFQVETPPQKLEEEQPPKLYRFDYQVQTPVTNAANGGNINLQGLLARADKVVMQNVEEQPPKLYRFDYQVQTPVTNAADGGNINLQGLSARADRVVMQNVEEQPPKLYRFDYQVQTPVTNAVDGGNINLQGLLARADRVVMQNVEEQPPKLYRFDYQVQTPVTNAVNGGVVIQKPDYARSINGCKCNSYKPTIDILQSCPKHGHLYQSGGPLCPMNQQRYNQESNLQQQNPDQQVSTSADRSKRDVIHNFPIKIKEMLPGLGLQNQIRKTSAEDENEKRVSEIMKANFGIDPNENVDELLTPKQFSLQSIPSELHEAQDHIKLKTSDFVGKITPKIQEARTNMKSHLTKIVNQARLNAIKMNSMIQKRSADLNSSDDVDIDFNNANDGTNKSIRLPAYSEQSDKVKVNSENVNWNDQSRRERIRKHCDRCGELARKYPCPSCAEASLEPSQPQYIEMRQGNPVPFVPRNTNARQTSNHNTQPRYVFDRFGHRYLEHNGKLKLIGPEQDHDDATVVGSYQSDAAYSEVEDILDRNSGLIHKMNRRVGEGHLLQPLNLEHATDAIRFIQELTQKNNDQYNEDYYSNADSYVGRQPAKRSFQIVPLAEDKDDGSVLVKILPTGSLSKNENKKFRPETKVSTKADAVNSEYLKPSIEENIFGKEKTDVKPNFDKIVRDGKKYEILSLSGNGSDEESVDSDEDMEILKYIYAANYREQVEGNASTELNNSKNDETRTGSQLET